MEPAIRDGHSLSPGLVPAIGSHGIIIHCVEVYTGYEYLDVDASTTNSLLGGLRLWF